MDLPSEFLIALTEPLRDWFSRWLHISRESYEVT